MTDKIPKEILNALEKLNLPNEFISRLTLQSTLLKDLKITGDDFEDFYVYLCQEYGVERPFPSRYIPPEGSWDTSAISWGEIIPGFDRLVKAPPLTIEMIDHHMRGESILR